MTDPEPEFSPRLDAITTRWSLVCRAHDGTGSSIGEARNALVLRYSPAIRKYIRALTRDEEEADEVAQDIVVRMLKGDFHGADPQRGRFRDLLKVSVRNMVRNYWSRQKRRAAVDLDVEHIQAEAGTSEEGPWLDAWSQNVRDLAWKALEDYERRHSGSVVYTILRLRADYPDDSSEQLAERLSERTGRNVRPEAARQQLRRARLRYVELLVEEVADVLDEPTADRIEDELITLGLFEHVRNLLPPNWKAKIPRRATGEQ